ncbi:MAG: DNA polymerase III subunit beta [Gammaproteobacteria bacterium]|nr:MAG: DNA polymerase III subunit beta [Gammaproteobacteria bacterium]
MKLSVDKSNIVLALQKVIGVVERRQTLPVLSNVLLRAEKDKVSLTATDLEVELVATVQMNVETTGEVTIPARKFFDICKNIPDGSSIELELKGDRIHMRAGRSRFSLATLPVTEFPIVDDIKSQSEITLSRRDLHELLERTWFCMAQQDVRYYLNGIMMELGAGRLRVVATDGHRLALYDHALGKQSSLKQCQVILPRKGVQELMRLLDDSDEPVTLNIGTNHVRISLDGIELTSKLIDGRFPEYERVLPKSSDKKMTANREEYRSSLTRASILSNEKFKGVRLILNGNNLKVQAHNPEQEEAEDEIDVQFTGDALEIGFNASYLLDALNAIRTDTVVMSLSDPNSSCLILEPGNDKVLYVVMPMRL